MNSVPHNDLPAWWWAVIPLAMFTLTTYAYLASPELMTLLIRRDIDPQGGGIAEHGTVLILLPGIAAGFVVLQRYRQALPLWLMGWVLGVTIACIYFAGEEASWGQHYLGWTTPEALKSLNDQQETNLHNIGTWFDQKPRTLVELWVVIAGLLIPAFRWWRPRATRGVTDWRTWFWPTRIGMLTAAIFLASAIVALLAKKTGSPALHNAASNELREFYIAMFLSTYLLSIWFRMRQRPAPGA